MATTTILRPSATSSGVGWTATPSGTLHGVTSDDNDATYALWSGDGSTLILGTPPDSPPAGERRHRVRMRARGEDGDAFWAVRLSSGALVAGASGQFSPSPGTVTGSWGFGAPPDGSTVLYAYVTGQSTGVKINELFIDMDSRLAPTFTPQILDGSGTSTTTISDTTQPIIRADNPDLDGLAARQYRYWVTLNGAIVWDTGISSGASADRQTTPLANGSYVAHLQIWTTLGSNTAYASDEETLAFTVLVGLVPAPDNPTVDPVDGTPFYTVTACAPFVGDFDGEVGYVEIQRVDCPVGGYLSLLGSSGSYASAPAPVTVLHGFESTTEGWIGEGSEVTRQVSSPEHGGGESIALADGSFNTSVANWSATDGTLAYSTAQSYNGAGSALLTTVGAPTQAYLRPTGLPFTPAVIGGRDYRVKGRIRSSAAITARMSVDWFDTGVNYQTTDSDTAAIPANTWVTFAKTFTAPVDGFASYGPNVDNPPNGTQVFVNLVDFVEVTTHDGDGALEVSANMGAGTTTLRFNDAHGGLRDLTPLGSMLSAWILVPETAGGTGWVAHLELQDPVFNWPDGPVSALTPGVWTRLTYTPDTELMMNCRAIGVEISGTGVNDRQAIYLDTVSVLAGPDSALLPPTDLEVTVHAQSDDWFPAGEGTLAAQFDTASNQGAWRLTAGTDGFLTLSWSEDGTGTVTSAHATERAPIDPLGGVRVRASLDVDDGAGGWTVTFATQEDEDSPWVQLGDVASNSGGGTTSMFVSSAPYTVGAYLIAGVPSSLFAGRVYTVQVRDGAAGAVIVSPDFTSHMSGTTTFTDAEDNIWTVHSPAAIVSPESTVTIAMLGPLVTDECADWIDFTLPRTSPASPCDHAPDPCCSYYRARTVGRVDGNLQISNWSDASNPGIPTGLIVMWPSTEASIPEGWNRVSELDGLYMKGIPNAGTNPGGTGGTGTHAHSLATHVHDTSHTHTHTGDTSAGVGALNSTPNAAGTAEVLSTHTHTRPTTSSATVNSGATTPTIVDGSNDVARLEVIMIASDGTPLGVPDGALGFMPDISVSGWSDYADATNRMIKGIIGATGGIPVSSALDSHTHALGAHTHTGTAHTHSATSGSVASTRALTAGAQAVLGQTSHTHLLSAVSASTQSLASGGAASSGAGPASMFPPYRNLRVKENTSGIPDLPVGLICAWRGSVGAIPDFWQLCDGTNSTPDMFGLYPRGATAAVGTTGGSAATHNHTSPTHNHTTTGHAHTETVAPAGATTASVSTTNTISVSTAAHTHTGTDVNSTTPTVASVTSGTLSSVGTEPPFEEVAYVQLMEEPTPGPDPALFCLEWDEDRHLIRTLGPDGPMWANVGGQFSWDVTRPFTAASGVMGSRFVTSAPPGGRNLHMTAAVESEEELAILHAVLGRPLVLISPSDAEEVWAAPVAESVTIIQIGRIRQVTADFIGTGPQPPPQLADVGV